MPALRPLARAAVLVLALAAAGCGSDPAAAPTSTTTTTTSGDPTITLAEWQEETAAICEDFEPQQAAIVAEHPNSSTMAEVGELVDALAPLIERYVAALGAVAVPAERTAEVQRTYELNQLSAESVAALRGAVTQDDRVAFDAAATALEAQTDELETLFTDLGVPACV